MIKNIKELQNFVLQDLKEDDELIFQRTSMMTSPGCSKEEIEKLKKELPDIPDSYTKWIEAVNLNGIDIGYFGASPFSFNPRGMVANLIDGNKEGVLFWEQMKEYHLYSVATMMVMGLG